MGFIARIISPLLVLLAADGLTAASCEKGWVTNPISGSNTCFKFVTNQKASWSKAQEMCNEMGGYLANLETLDEIHWMRGYRLYHPTLRSYTWIGGYKKNGVWMWTKFNTDIPIQVADWENGEPNNGAGGDPQNCVGLFGSAYPTKLYKWDDGWCKVAHDYICERILE